MCTRGSVVDALTYIRLLKDLRISVIFETENIDTLTPGGEVLITILAGLAEQEARNISKNVVWGFNKKFENDGIIMPTKNFLGFTRDAEKKVVIDFQEAVIVQRIFREFIGGYSTKQIANRLTADGIKTPWGKDKWQATTIRSIIRNPKYCGDAIMGKTYKPDVLSPKRLKNDGIIRDLFYIPDCCPAIISKEMFKLAKAEDEKRSVMRSATKTGSVKYSNANTFSGMLTCGCCGSKWRRWAQGYHSGQKKEYLWVCINKQTFKECSEKPVKEEAIKKAFVRVLNELIGSGTDFIATLRNNICAEISDNLTLEIENVDARLSVLQTEALRLNRDNRQGQIGNTEYDNLIAENERLQIILHQERNAKILKSEGIKLTEFRITEIERILTETIQGDLFDSDIFKELMESAAVTREKIIFNFKCGISVEAELEQSVRKYSDHKYSDHK